MINAMSAPVIDLIAGEKSVILYRASGSFVPIPYEIFIESVAGIIHI